LFVPTTRFRDLYRFLERDRADDRRMNRLVELELAVTGSSVEDIFLHCGFTWSDFYSWARGKMVWISPDVFFNLTGIRTSFQTEYRTFLEVRIVPSEEYSLRVYARSEANATVASDILLQLLTTCQSRNVNLWRGNDSDRFPSVSGLAFSHFLAKSRNLRNLSLGFLGLDTCHCRAIDAFNRTDLQIELSYCKLTEPGEQIILECIRQNRGPTKLIGCRIDTRRLAGALRGNNSVNTLHPHKDCSDEDRLV
jgi:hypothetical protein